MKTILYLLIAVFALKNEIFAQTSPKVEVLLSTTGTLIFTRTKTSTNAGLNAQTASEMVKQSTDGDGIKIFNSRENAGKAHGTIEVKMVDNGQLTFHTQTGNVSLSNFKANVRGTVTSGDVALMNISGQAQISVKRGNIVVEGTETQGVVITQQGNITLKNPSKFLTSTTANGTTQVEFLATYPLKKAIEYRLEKGNVRVNSVVEPLKIDLAEGKIDVENVQKKVELTIEKAGDITIKTANSGIKALTRKGNISLQISANNNTSELTRLQTDEGNVTLDLPANFSGILQLELVQNQEFMREFSIAGSAKLPNTAPQSTLSPTGAIISKRTAIRQVFGNDSRLVQVLVRHGNITINQL